MHLPEEGHKCGRNMWEANYVYSILLKLLYASVGFITMSNQLNAWSWIDILKVLE